MGKNTDDCINVLGPRVFTQMAADIKTTRGRLPDFFEKEVNSFLHSILDQPFSYSTTSLVTLLCVYLMIAGGLLPPTALSGTLPNVYLTMVSEAFFSHSSV